ncbi:hypothetical protein BCR33DRAFT_861398 [Rhizoclosmatium globosum]|uniref:Uncharacterized protein n=1 Tax=Rhizoclosmatium globosum TaxID=329046 RepID=A0A1Y2AJ63_9FUNG|nr:hypothetical protein BCR33DRAFT_861398 [Rhizoclosmatium globosum]|eukprot:ORY22534.1 hypothetical protein BCR33DRAFT_861398 [Rhizoclosmatium globosum]
MSSNLSEGSWAPTNESQHEPSHAASVPSVSSVSSVSSRVLPVEWMQTINAIATTSVSSIAALFDSTAEAHAVQVASLAETINRLERELADAREAIAALNREREQVRTLSHLLSTTTTTTTATTPTSTTSNTANSANSPRESAVLIPLNPLPQPLPPNSTTTHPPTLTTPQPQPQSPVTPAPAKRKKASKHEDKLLFVKRPGKASITLTQSGLNKILKLELGPQFETASRLLCLVPDCKSVLKTPHTLLAHLRDRHCSVAYIQPQDVLLEIPRRDDGLFQCQCCALFSTPSLNAFTQHSKICSSVTPTPWAHLIRSMLPSHLSVHESTQLLRQLSIYADMFRTEHSLSEHVKKEGDTELTTASSATTTSISTSGTTAPDSIHSLSMDKLFMVPSNLTSAFQSFMEKHVNTLLLKPKQVDMDVDSDSNSGASDSLSSGSGTPLSSPSIALGSAGCPNICATDPALKSNPATLRIQSPLLRGTNAGCIQPSNAMDSVVNVSSVKGSTGTANNAKISPASNTQHTQPPSSKNSDSLTNLNRATSVSPVTIKSPALSSVAGTSGTNIPETTNKRNPATKSASSGNSTAATVSAISKKKEALRTVKEKGTRLSASATVKLEASVIKVEQIKKSDALLSTKDAVPVKQEDRKKRHKKSTVIFDDALPKNQSSVSKNGCSSNSVGGGGGGGPSKPSTIIETIPWKDLLLKKHPNLRITHSPASKFVVETAKAFQGLYEIQGHDFLGASGGCGEGEEEGKFEIPTALHDAFLDFMRDSLILLRNEGVEDVERGCDSKAKGKGKQVLRKPGNVELPSDDTLVGDDDEDEEMGKGEGVGHRQILLSIVPNYDFLGKEYKFAIEEGIKAYFDSEGIPLHDVLEKKGESTGYRLAWDQVNPFAEWLREQLTPLCEELKMDIKREGTDDVVTDRCYEETVVDVMPQYKQLSASSKQAIKLGVYAFLEHEGVAIKKKEREVVIPGRLDREFRGWLREELTRCFPEKMRV